MTTLVTLPWAVPDPPETVHDSPLGGVLTVTVYAAPAVSGVANVNGPSALTERSSPPLSSRTAVPVRPLIEPPTVYVTGGGGVPGVTKLTTPAQRVPFEFCATVS